MSAFHSDGPQNVLCNLSLGLTTLSREFTDRLTRVERSVDAVAIEVERIGEGQRFITRFFTEKGTPRAPGNWQPIEIKAR